jgi:AGZA family xanthine/uracil permease-like MFS transporter
MAVMEATGGRVPVSSESGSFVERWFKVHERGSTVGTEVRAGITTFMVMSYIIFVNPAILGFSGVKDLEGQGLPFPAVSAATALLAGLLTIGMGLFTNYPFAMAAGLGLNAVAAFQLHVQDKLPWPAVMGIFFWEGLVITILVLTGLRELIIDAIPMSLKRATGVGIGLFILFIGLNQAGFIAPGPSSSEPVTLANLRTWPLLVAVVGLVLTAVLHARGMRGALLIGILATTVLATIVNYATGLTAFTTPGAAQLPASVAATPDLSLIGQFDPISEWALLGAIGAVLAIFSIMLSDFFDTMGTVLGIGAEAGWLDKDGRLPGLKRVLLVDSLGAMFGGIFSTSSNTTFIESAAGVAEGGRTGLTSVVTGLLFLAAVFISPWAGIVPKEATAPALIIVGYLMFLVAREIPWDDFEQALPALLTMTIMPFTYSITNGVGIGFIAFVLIKALRGKAGQVHPLLWVVSLLFAIYFAFGLR